MPLITAEVSIHPSGLKNIVIICHRQSHPAGIVVNNNIVLIDTFEQVRKSVSDPMEAILHTGAQRMRPVLLTTATAILGLMLMVFSTNIDFVTRDVFIRVPSTQWWAHLSSAKVFSPGFATVLTLIVTPSSLMIRAKVHVG